MKPFKILIDLNLIFINCNILLIYTGVVRDIHFELFLCTLYLQTFTLYRTFAVSVKYQNLSFNTFLAHYFKVALLC